MTLLSLRTPTAINFNLFDPGDSVFKSLNLVNVAFEAVELINSATRLFNLDNTIQLPASPLSYDDDTRTASFTVLADYVKVAGRKVCRNYLDSYAGWVTPTTGELAGITTLLDAYMYIIEALVYVNEKLQETPAVKNVKTLLVFTDNNNSNQYSTSGTLPFASVTSATGVIQKIAQNYPVLLDLQEGLPLA